MALDEHNSYRTYITKITATMGYTIQRLLQDNSTYSRDDFVFFWGHTDRKEGVGKCCLSQWYMCQFVVDDVCYNCVEQYMMAEKARIFGDEHAW